MPLPNKRNRFQFCASIATKTVLWNDKRVMVVGLALAKGQHMKLKTIALAAAFACASTFALAQAGGSAGSSSAGTSTGTTTGANTSGAANQGTGATAIESNKMEPGSSQSPTSSGTTGAATNSSQADYNASLKDGSAPSGTPGNTKK
jgi:hypothetical protein